MEQKAADATAKFPVTGRVRVRVRVTRARVRVRSVRVNG